MITTPARVVELIEYVPAFLLKVDVTDQQGQLLWERYSSQIEVDFLSPFLAPPEEPLMLRSDALPTRALPTTDASMLIRTDEGPTFVHFKTTTHSSADSDGL